MITNAQRAEILVHALPYIKKYDGKIIVVKYGGNAMINEELKSAVMGDLVLLNTIGIKVVLVHGGGPEISEMLNKVGKKSEFVNGLRVTDAETAEIVQMVLAGKINKTLVNQLQNSGGKAVGLSGMDGHLIEAKVKDTKLGFVGEITNINIEPVTDLLEKGYIPVISTVGCDKKGNVYNKLDVHFAPDTTQEKKPCIVYFHGGGWSCYSKCVYTTLCRRLAKLGYVVFNVNYSLAPKHKMEYILSDCLKAINYIQEIAENYGGDKESIILAGDSAGAHLSAMIAGYSVNNKPDFSVLIGKIKALILIYGVFDINTMLESKFINIKTYGKSVLKGKLNDISENTKFSPINYINTNFPPCLIASGEVDKLHETQSKVFYEKLTESGVKTKKVFFDKNEKSAGHAYVVFDNRRATKITLQEIEKFLKEDIKC